MKVALVSSAYHPYYRGGGEYSAKQLAEQLHRQGVNVFVLTAFRRTQTDTVDGVKVYRVKHPNVYWSYDSAQQPAYRKLIWHLVEGYNVRVAKRVASILEQERPDVLHIRNTEDFSPYLAKVAQSYDIPVVVTLNSYTWLCPRATMFRSGRNCTSQCWDCKLMTYPKKQLSRYVDAVVGVSQFTLDQHLKRGYFPRARPVVIHTAIPMQSQSFPAAQQDGITFGYIGRLHPTKGILPIIEAFGLLPPPHRLLIAGDGPDDYVQACQRAANPYPGVTFLGKYPAEMFYARVDIVIINALWNEPFPRVLVEAYAAGRPVMAAATGGTPEMVSEQTGWLHDPQLPQQLAANLRRVAQLSLNDLLQMQKNITHRMRQPLPNDAEQYATLYASLVQS